MCIYNLIIITIFSNFDYINLVRISLSLYHTILIFMVSSLWLVLIFLPFWLLYIFIYFVLILSGLFLIIINNITRFLWVWHQAVGVFARKKSLYNDFYYLKMVGKKGFEPPTAWSQTKCSTKLNYFPIMARQIGVEPITFWSVVKRSIQLSY